MTSKCCIENTCKLKALVSSLPGAWCRQISVHVGTHYKRNIYFQMHRDEKAADF